MVTAAQISDAQGIYRYGYSMNGYASRTSPLAYELRRFHFIALGTRILQCCPSGSHWSNSQNMSTSASSGCASPSILLFSSSSDQNATSPRVRSTPSVWTLASIYQPLQVYPSDPVDIPSPMFPLAGLPSSVKPLSFNHWLASSPCFFHFYNSRNLPSLLP